MSTTWVCYQISLKSAKKRPTESKKQKKNWYGLILWRILSKVRVLVEHAVSWPNPLYTHIINGVVSFPDPTLKEGKGLVYIEHFLGLDDVSVLNPCAPIRFLPCGIFMTIIWHCAIVTYSMCVRAVDALPCQNDVLSCQSHDMPHPVAQDIAQCRPDPFPPWGWGMGLGMRLCMELCYKTSIIVLYASSILYPIAIAFGSIKAGLLEITQLKVKE